MSGADRTRGCSGPAPPQTDHNDAPHPGCPECGWEIEVLYELADAARKLDVIDMGEHGVAVVGFDEVRSVLSRLDGESTR